jgi:hypothetical protein
MPRYEYRHLNPLPAAGEAFDRWLDQLDEQFSHRDVNHRSELVRNALHELYLGEPYAPPAADEPLATQALVHSFDPRNATLEPEYYGDIDGAKYAERKPLIYFG